MSGAPKRHMSSGAMDALQIVQRDRDEWKRRATVAEARLALAKAEHRGGYIMIEQPDSDEQAAIDDAWERLKALGAEP